MEKTIMIDGRAVRFKSTAGTLLRYKSHFGREFLADCAALANCFAKSEDGKVDMSTADLDNFNMDMVYNITWVMARTADANVPDILTWLDGFDSFPAITILNELIPLIFGSLKVDAKNA